MTFNYLPLDYNKKSNNGNHIVIKQAGANPGLGGFVLRWLVPCG